jgi:hypothetical protein
VYNLLAKERGSEGKPVLYNKQELAKQERALIGISVMTLNLVFSLFFVSGHSDVLIISITHLRRFLQYCLVRYHLLCLVCLLLMPISAYSRLASSCPYLCTI